MSAPTAVDRGAVSKGLAWTVDPPSLDDGGTTVQVQHDRRDRTSSVAQLSRAHDELCTQAVDSYEIAAGLEAAGINDRTARLVYGSASVFDLAQTLFDLVPRRPADPGTPEDRWHRPLRLHLTRGLLYGLPGLLYAVAFGTLQPGAGPVLLLFATIAACGFVQGISVIGNMLLGWGENRAAMTLFRSALVAGGVGLAVLAGAGWVSGPYLGAALLAGVQLEYMLAATVLLVLHAEKQLLLVLTPGVVLATATLAGLLGSIPVPVIVMLLGLCPVAAVWAAVTQIDAHSTNVGRSLKDVTRTTGKLRETGLVFLGYGVANAGLVSFAVVDALTGGADAAGGHIVLMMLPLVAGLGVAEWLVHRLRSRGALVLHRTTSTGTFRSQAVSSLMMAVLGYGAALAAAVAVVVSLYDLPGAPGRLFLVSASAYAVLGVAFLLETLLLSLGRHHLALGFAAAALVVDTVFRWRLAGEPAVELAQAHLVVFTLLLLFLIPTTAVQYRSVGMHR